MSASQHYTTAAEDKISLKQKSAYAVGMLVNNLQAAALPAMVVILNLGLGMDALWVGFIGAIPRIFDAISDPMVGYISDNTHSRWGRRRPFIFAGAILAGLIFAYMWQLPSGYIDILGKTPAKAHQTRTHVDSEAKFNEAGGIELIVDPASSISATVRMYGPESLTNESLFSDLSGFPQIELNAAIPKSEAAVITFTTLGGSKYHYTLSDDEMGEGKGQLIQISLDHFRDDSGAESGFGLNQVESMEFQLTGIQEAGLLTLHAFKLKKEEGFYVYWFWLFLALSILFFLAYTLYATPFVAFGYEMTPDYHERTRLHAFANTVGQLAWLGVPWFYAIMSSSLFDDTVHGARTLAIYVGAAVAILGVVPAIFLRERQTFEKVEKATKSVWQNMTEFFKGLGTTLRCKPFLKLCGTTFLVFNGFQLGMSFSIYVMIYYLFSGNDNQAGQLMGWFGMITSIATLGVIPLTGWIATRIGKRKTFMITISLSLLGYALKWVGYNPEHPYWLVFAAPFVAFGTGSLFTLMGSMISDVCDYDELETHQRREGVFGAIYWWMVKIGMALAGLLTGVLLKVAGFDVGLGAGQAEATLLQLRLFDVGIPLITSAIALGIMYTYTITEERAHEIRTELEFRRGKMQPVDTSGD